MTPSLAQTIAAHDNDHTGITAQFRRGTGRDWHEPTPAFLGRSACLSVIIPAHNNEYSLPTVLDALAKQNTAAQVEVIVIDDASTDDTPAIIKAHPVVDAALRLPEQVGAATARNIGVYLAEGDTLVFCDADMVLPEHVLADFAARAYTGAVLVGFRHDVAHHPGSDGRPIIPSGEPDLHADHRVRWTPPAQVPMFYSGQVYDTPFVGQPLDDTQDFVDLGHGRSYFDWDLPRMVVTALVAAPRAAVLDVGGFHPGFQVAGWGSEDTHLGAALIAHGCKVIPLRQARGWHLDPPDADTAWKAKLAGAAPRVALLRHLLTEPPPTGQDAAFRDRIEPLVRKATPLT
ncbi:MAG TPA: glycosyltransferase [Catenuloplanes sp.]|jgi:GT2 family glycosyltransferase